MTSALSHFARLQVDPEPDDVDYRQVQSSRGKERYATPQLALTVAKRRNRTGKRNVSHYLCRWCQGFHLGTGTKSMFRRRVR